jgi:hypothetical protein
MVHGHLRHVHGFQAFKGRPLRTLDAPIAASTNAHRRITYNPFIHATLVHVDDGSEYLGSRYAVFTAQQLWAFD